jgi:hypothetical protein
MDRPAHLAVANKILISNPTAPDGWICVLDMFVVGGFSEWTLRPDQQVEYCSIERAKSIRNSGMKILL